MPVIITLALLAAGLFCRASALRLATTVERLQAARRQRFKLRDDARRERSFAASRLRAAVLLEEQAQFLRDEAIRVQRETIARITQKRWTVDDQVQFADSPGWGTNKLEG